MQTTWDMQTTQYSGRHSHAPSLGTFRMPCRLQTVPRPISRNLPNNRPQRGGICGTSHGCFRETNHNEYMVQRGFEDEAGNELKPFHDRVVRAGEEGFADSARDTIMLNADAAFAGMPNWDSANDEGEAGGISNRQARRTGLKRQGQLVEESDDGWRHAPVRPAPHVELPQWLMEEPYKVAHRDYSTGFYYPEQKVTQNTDRSAYFRDWLVVGEVLSWSPEEGGRVTIMSRNKMEPGQLVEFLLPGRAPLEYVVPDGGIRDADGNEVPMVNNPAHVFSLPLGVEVPVNAALRSRTKKPTLKAE